jgi:hypothetical protein
MTKYPPRMSPRAGNLILAKPALRLADAIVEPAPHAAARRAIAQENHAAALGANDARWLFAQHVRESVEGGRAAIIRPQVRRELVSQAHRMGLRPFDANLVIAIVQDAARHAENLDEITMQRLALIPSRAAASPIGPLMLLGAAIGLAAGLLALFVAWLMG